jgi:hypothetical protein
MRLEDGKAILVLPGTFGYPKCLCGKDNHACSTDFSACVDRSEHKF